jgi:hypothetical protein
MKERSKYQNRVIRDYYKNRDAIALQRAQELVTELYLATGKKRQRYWESLSTHLEKLGAKPALIEHFLQQDDPETVAHWINNLIKRNP